MYYGSGTVGRIASVQPAHAVGNRQTCTCIQQMAALFCVKWRLGRYLQKSEIRLHQSMHIYLKNNPSKSNTDPIKNDGALASFEEVVTTRKRRSVAIMYYDMSS